MFETLVERICIIVVVNLIMFYRTLRFKFVSDDIAQLEAMQKSGKKWPKNVFIRFWRQLIATEIYSEQEAHLVSIILHTLVCVFIYLGLGKNNISFLTALLFCVNPRNNQGSIWISGRVSYVIPTLLLLIAMAIPYVSPIALFYTTMPATAFIYPLAYLGSPCWYFILFMPVIWFLNFKHFRKQVGSKIQHESVKADIAISFRKLIIPIKTYGYYFFMCLVPDKIAFYHSFMQSAAGSGNVLMNKRAYALDKMFWFGLTILIFFPLYAIFHGWDGICWGVWWFSVCIAPYLNYIRVNQEISERYCYAGLVGLMYSLANVILNMGR